MPGVCCTHFEGGDCQAIQGLCADGCAWEEAAWERLAAYEDTGLEPEEVTQIKLAIMGKSLAEIKEFEGVSIDRMIELTQAEKDGRLVMLPDAKYTDADGEKALQKAMWVCGNTNNPVTRYTADAIAEKLCREVRDENPPLTLEELREMDGEPVWIAGADDDAIEGNGYAVVEFARSDFPQIWWFGNEVEMMPPTENYGKTWRAYRRKPEEKRKMMDYDNPTFAQKLRKGAVIKDGTVLVSTQLWEIVTDRIAESVPQQHGTWIWNPNGMDWGLGAWQCSICGCKNDNLPCDAKINPHIFAGSRFCPNCGAKMDAEVKTQ